MIKLADNIGTLYLDLNLNSSTFNKQVKNVTNSATNQFSKLGSTILKVLSVGALVSFGKSCIDLGSDLSEVQNVVDVTFPNMSAQVDQFAKNAINSFGLSETVAKRMTGTFGSMAKAFGYSEKEAYNMATSLTGLAGDVASFYNLDPTEAYTKLKSVFSGETETLKDLGVVMTQNALDQYALANGYGKTTSAMSEQEKVALRLAFVTDQLSAASGDFIRTSDSWANKVRVLSLNFQTLKATIGQGLINLFSPIVSVINAVIVKLQGLAQAFVAFTQLFTGGKNVVASIGGISDNVSVATDQTEELSSGLDNVGSSAKKAAKQTGSLASFDEIKNISTDSGSSGSEGGVSGSSSGVSFDIPEVDTTKQVASLGKLEDKIKSVANFFKKYGAIITSALAGIGAGFVAFETIKNWGTISKGVSDVTSYISNLFKVIGTGKSGLQALLFQFTGLSVPMAAVVAGIAAVTAALVYLYQTSDTFRNLVNTAVSMMTDILSNLWNNVLVPLFEFLADVFETVVVPIATFLAEVFVKAVEAVATIALSLWTNVLAPIADFLVSVFSTTLQAVIDIWEKWKPLIEGLFDILDWIWNEMLSPLADFIVGSFTEVFENFGAFIEELIPSLEQIFQGFADFFVGVFTLDIDKAWSGIKEIFEGFSNFLETIFQTDWTETFGVLGNLLKYAFFANVSNIWNSIKTIFSGVIDFISGVFTGNWEQAWNGVQNIFKGIWDGLVSIVKAPINAMIALINAAIDGINSLSVDIPDWVPFVGGQHWGMNLGKIPYLAQGGYVKANSPQLAVIGDNKTQGEIIAPENKLMEIVTNALHRNSNNDDVQVLVSLLYEILDAIKNLRLVVDGDALNQDSNKRNAEKALRTGMVV